MKRVITIFMLVATLGVLAPAAQAAPTKATTAASQCQEDQPCWNCSIQGNFICGPKPARAAEAWKAFDPGVFTAEELSKPMTVTYRGTTSRPNSLPNGHEWYTIPVKGSRTLHHVFEVVFGK